MINLHLMTSNMECSAMMLPLGESAVLVEFGGGIHPDTHRKVKAFTEYLDRHSVPGMMEYVSAFSSVTVFYDSLMVKQLHQDHVELKEEPSYRIISVILQKIVTELRAGDGQKSRVVEIPVCYGGELGPDLAYVAEYNKLTIDEVIEIHSKGDYLVYMIGFAPGFPYLGGMSEKISTPRRQSPRMSISAGSVGIAGMQTGVYPIPTPGGWQLIGRTPLELFCPNENSPSLLQAGDRIRFYPISPQEYEEYKRERI